MFKEVTAEKRQELMRHVVTKEFEDRSCLCRLRQLKSPQEVLYFAVAGVVAYNALNLRHSHGAVSVPDTSMGVTRSSIHRL